jgi:AcrR family transcriptional regulator
VRITAEEKDATRQRITQAAIELFKNGGFEDTTTRDIARRAKIATGTLFNYFQTKETILAHLVAEALRKARGMFAKQAIEADLEEELFALIAAELRQLRPFRKFLPALLDTELSPLMLRSQVNAEDALRVAHLEVMAGIARKHGVPELSTFATQIYWTLYTGVLVFWSADTSPKQEDTLALLDQSLHMFIAWLKSGDSNPR